MIELEAITEQDEREISDEELSKFESDNPYDEETEGVA